MKDEVMRLRAKKGLTNIKKKEVLSRTGSRVRIQATGLECPTTDEKKTHTFEDVPVWSSQWWRRALGRKARYGEKKRNPSIGHRNKKRERKKKREKISLLSDFDVFVRVGDHGWSETFISRSQKSGASTRYRFPIVRYEPVKQGKIWPTGGKKKKNLWKLIFKPSKLGNNNQLSSTSLN